MLAVLAPLATIPLATLAWIMLGLRRVPMDIVRDERRTYQPRHLVRTAHRGNPLPARTPRHPERVSPVMPFGDGLTTSPMMVIRPQYIWVSDGYAPRTSR